MLRALLLALAIAPHALAAPGGAVSLHARLGFAGAVRAGRIAPLVVDVDALAASGPATLKGTFGGNAIAQPLALAPGTRKRLELMVPAIEQAAALEVVGPGGELLAREEVRAASTPRDAVVALLVTRVEAQSAAGGLDGLQLPRGVGVDPSPLVVARTTAADLPDHWAALDGVDMVVVGDDDLERAPAARLAALVHWAARGGTLVVCGGVRPARLAGTPLADALPVELNGRTRTLDALASLDAAFPSSTVAPARAAGLPAESQPGIAVREPFVVPEARARAGRVLVAEPVPGGAVPLLARRALGDGAAWYLALDLEKSPLAYTGRAVQARLWRAMAPRPESQDRPPLSRAHNYGRPPWALAGGRVVANEAARTLAVDPPGGGAAWLVGAFVALYWLLVGPAQYALLKRRNALHAVWVVTPLLALAFCALAFGIGYARRGGKTLARELAVVEGRAGDPVWTAEALVSVHAFTETAYALAPGPGPGLAVPYRLEDDDLATWTRTGAAAGIGDAVVPMWADRLFWTVTAGVEPDPVRAELEVGDDAHGSTLVAGTLDPGRPLKNAHLVLGEQWARIGDLAGPARVRQALTETRPAVPPGSWRARSVRRRMDLRDLAGADALAELLVKPPSRQLLLVGVREAPPSLAITPPVSAQERRTLVAIALPYELRTVLPVKIPPGYAHRRTDLEPDLPVAALPHSASARYQVRLFPFPRPKLEPRELEVVLRRGDRIAHDVKLLHRVRGSWDVVVSPATAPTPGSSGWRWNEPVARIPVMDARDYVMMPEGLLDVQIVPAAGAGSGDTRVDFELKGLDGDPEAWP